MSDGNVVANATNGLNIVTFFGSRLLQTSTTAAANTPDGQPLAASTVLSNVKVDATLTFNQDWTLLLDAKFPPSNGQIATLTFTSASPATRLLSPSTVQSAAGLVSTIMWLVGARPQIVSTGQTNGGGARVTNNSPALNVYVMLRYDASLLKTLDAGLGLGLLAGACGVGFAATSNALTPIFPLRVLDIGLVPTANLQLQQLALARRSLGTRAAGTCLSGLGLSSLAATTTCVQSGVSASLGLAQVVANQTVCATTTTARGFAGQRVGLGIGLGLGLAAGLAADRVVVHMRNVRAVLVKQRVAVDAGAVGIVSTAWTNASATLVFSADFGHLLLPPQLTGQQTLVELCPGAGLPADVLARAGDDTLAAVLWFVGVGNVVEIKDGVPFVCVTNENVYLLLGPSLVGGAFAQVADFAHIPTFAPGTLRPCAAAGGGRCLDGLANSVNQVW